MFLFPELHVLVGWFPRNFGEDGVRHEREDVISGDDFHHRGSRGGVVVAECGEKDVRRFSARSAPVGRELDIVC